MFVRVLGAHPDELRVLATVLRRAAHEAAWLRRRIDSAQDRARLGGADTPAVAIADGADCLSQLRVLRDQESLFGPVASHATAWRAMESVTA
ncbi:MAG: hypothetical protein M3Q48_01175, partial [Actinomycetota bacterium]|nr:hypothetical protein [Actinomycetota bacterium]